MSRESRARRMGKSMRIRESARATVVSEFLVSSPERRIKLDFSRV